MSDNKAVIALGVGLAAAAGLFIWSQTKAENGEEPILDITILDSDGNPVLINSPASLVEGAGYTLRITITNTSTREGVPWPVEFIVSVQAGTTLPFLDFLGPIGFTASEVKVLDMWFTVNDGLAGTTGAAIVEIFDPDMNSLAVVEEELIITSMLIDYGADIIIVI